MECVCYPRVPQRVAQKEIFSLKNISQVQSNKVAIKFRAETSSDRVVV